MILVDTNIIINYWKNPNDEYKNIFLREDISICGIVKAELIHGARSEKEIDKIITALDCFTFINILDQDWVEIGRLLNSFRKSGLKVPFQDAVLSYIAIKNNLPIWTNDKHFDLIKTAANELKIYKID